MFLLLCQISHAQQLEVLEFHADPTLIDAVMFPKNDLNDERCGLVKVGLVMPDAVFEGNVVHAEYKTGEWWVYLTRDTRWLGIKSNDYLPLRYEFPEPIQNNVTYVMTVEKKEKKENVEEVINILPKVDVSYYEKGGFMENKLYAKVDGIEYFIDVPDESYDPTDPDYIYTKCYSVAEEDDFDGNGIADALIEETVGCGNIGLMAYFIVSYSGDGYFSISNTIVGNAYSVENWKGKKSIVIINSNVGIDSDKLYGDKERYVLKDGKLELVETLKKQSIMAVKELKSSDFNREGGKPMRLEYDLDENGITDYIECFYWSRWGSMMVEHFVLNGKEMDEPPGEGSAFRIGVLSSKTKGYHDLVFDENNIYKWNGKEYISTK